MLKSILKDAVDDGLIATNPCRVKAGAQKTRAREIEVLTVGQLEAYLAALPENRRVPLLLAGWCGLRSGEVRGLRVRDLDLDAGVVHVRQAVVRVIGQLIIGPPKTAAGIRTVAIPPHLLPMLRIWLTAQLARKRDALLFPAGDGVSPRNESVLRDAHDKAKAVIGVPGLTIQVCGTPARPWRPNSVRPWPNCKPASGTAHRTWPCATNTSPLNATPNSQPACPP